MHITIWEERTKERTVEEENPVYKTQEDVRLGNCCRQIAVERLLSSEASEAILLRT